MRSLWICASVALWLTTATAAAQGTGALVITGSPDGAEIFLDAESVGRGPIAPLDLAPGRYTVRVSLPGFTEHNEVVTVEADGTTEVVFDLFPVAMVLELATMPRGAQAFIDGRFVGETPLSVDLLAGQRSLRLTLPGYRDRVERIDARPGTSSTLRFDLEAIPVEPPADGEEWYESPWPFIGIGAGVVAVATVLIVVLASGDDPSRVDMFCEPGCVLVMPDD